MFGGRLNISVLANSRAVIHGAIVSSVESTPPFWNNRHQLCICQKEASNILPALKHAIIVSGLLMIPFSDLKDTIAMAYFFVKLVQTFLITIFSIWCFNPVLNGLNTGMFKGRIRWVELYGMRTKIILSSIDFSQCLCYNGYCSHRRQGQ